jgi:ABC-2 type transport system permease protein
VQSYAFSRLLSLLFATLPPVYYPISYVPAPFNYLAYLSPTTYAAETIMHSATGYLNLSTNMLILNWSVLLVVCSLYCRKEDSVERGLTGSFLNLFPFQTRTRCNFI